MYHPLTLKTILKIQTAQRSATLPLIDHLRLMKKDAEVMIANGKEYSRQDLIDRGEKSSAEYAEQIRILEAITDEGREAYEQEVTQAQ